jgi:hypothetical protein
MAFFFELKPAENERLRQPYKRFQRKDCGDNKQCAVLSISFLKKRTAKLN